MERLTEHCCPGGIRIKGCKTLYPDVERRDAPASSAIVRLAAYEDTGLDPEEIEEMKRAWNAACSAYEFNHVEGK